MAHSNEHPAKPQPTPNTGGERPPYAHNYNRLGIELLQQCRFRAAADAFNCALQHNPDDLDALCNLGIALMRDGDWAAAERATRDYLKRAGGDLNAHTRLGIILRHLGDLNGALHVLKGVLQRDHRHALASQELGLTCLAMDLFQPAKLALKRALELKPGLVSAWLGLAEVHEAQNRPGLALRVYRDALRMTKRHKQGPICGRMGMLLARIGDREHARRLLERAIRLGEADPIYVFLLGDLSLQLGELTAAEEQLRVLQALQSPLAQRLKEKFTNRSRSG